MPNNGGWCGWLISTMLALAATGSAAAQDSSDVVRRLERQLRELDSTYRLMIPSDQPISERLLLDYGVVVRFGFYAIDDAFSTTHMLRQYDTALFVRAELDGAHRFFGQLRYRYDDWNSGDAFDGEDDKLAAPIGDRYWYEFDLRGAITAKTGQRPDHNINVRAGKQYVQWGSGLALNSVLYAALLDVEVANVGLVALAGLTPSTGTIDFDGSRPGFDEDTDRAFFGATLEYRGWSSHRPYVYFLTQRDRNERDFAVFQTFFGDVPTRFEYDSNYVGVGSRGSLGGRIHYRAELIHEFGEGLSNSFDRFAFRAVPQTTEDVDAWAGVLGLTYLFTDANDTRADLELLAGSGDSDRLDSSDTFGGNRPGTDDHAFNSLGYANTGLALAPDVSNLFSVRAGISTMPFPRAGPWLEGMRVGLAGFLFTKIDADAPVSVRTDASHFMGGEIDLFADWRLTSDLSMNLRYGVFLPGDAMPAGEDDARHFFYAGVTYAF